MADQVFIDVVPHPPSAKMARDDLQVRDLIEQSREAVGRAGRVGERNVVAGVEKGEHVAWPKSSLGTAAGWPVQLNAPAAKVIVLTVKWCSTAALLVLAIA